MVEMSKMDKKVYVRILILLLIPAFPLSTKAIATLYIDPPTTVTSVSDTFSVNITISDVIDLAGWEFKLYYLSSKLNGTDLEEGPFLKQGGSTYFAIINFTDNYNSTHGLAWVTCALLGVGPGVNGNGTLAVVTFKAKQLGTSSLSLTNTWLSDSQPIPHIALNGIVYILPHDVAITNLTPSKTVVGQGLNVKIYLNILNRGNFTETFNVTVYASTTIIGTLVNMTLAGGNSTTITFIWNTTGFEKYKNYTISAYAHLVQGEMDLTDNTFIDGTVIISIVGDIVPDKKVDLKDVGTAAKAFGSYPGHERWNPMVDINNDNKVDMKDIGTIAKEFGKTDL